MIILYIFLFLVTYILTILIIKYALCSIEEHRTIFFILGLIPGVNMLLLTIAIILGAFIVAVDIIYTEYLDMRLYATLGGKKSLWRWYTYYRHYDTHS